MKLVLSENWCWNLRSYDICRDHLSVGKLISRHTLAQFSFEMRNDYQGRVWYMCHIFSISVYLKNYCPTTMSSSVFLFFKAKYEENIVRYNYCVIWFLLIFLFMILLITTFLIYYPRILSSPAVFVCLSVCMSKDLFVYHDFHIIKLMIFDN